MINENLLEIIADFNFWNKPQVTGIERKELNDFLKFTDNKNLVLIITGIRRVGKTFLCKQILKKKIDQGLKPQQNLYVNFEDPALEPYLNTQCLHIFIRHIDIF